MSVNQKSDFALAQDALEKGDLNIAEIIFEKALQDYQTKNQWINIAACCNNLGIIVIIEEN